LLSWMNLFSCQECRESLLLTIWSASPKQHYKKNGLCVKRGD